MKHSSTKHKYHSLYNPVKVIEHNWSDNMIPMVSVVCITFNHKKYIRDAIEGFLMQETTFKIEILIGEDCSTDGTGTREIVFGYKKKYPDLIKVITSNSNVGMHANGIRTLNAVRGKYIALCEGDDYWIDPLKLQKQVDYMESHPGCSLSVHAAYRVNVKNKKIGRHFRPHYGNKIFTVEEMILGGGGLFATNSIMYPRKYYTHLPKFYFDAPIGDYPLVIYLALQGTVYYFDQFMSVYRTGVDGSWLTNQRKLSIQKITKFYEQTEKMLKEMDVYSKYKYSNTIRRYVLMKQFELMLIKGKFKEIKIGDYKEIYQNLSVKRKLLLIIKQYFPSSLKVLTI